MFYPGARLSVFITTQIRYYPLIWVACAMRGSARRRLQPIDIAAFTAGGGTALYETGGNIDQAAGLNVRKSAVAYAIGLVQI
jgi:hypothetical protein